MSLPHTIPRCAAVRSRRAIAALLFGITAALATTPLAGAQTVVLEPVPGFAEGSTTLDFTYYHAVAQVTRDGTRLVVRKGYEGDTLVVDARTGSTVLDTRILQTPERTYVTSLLAPDGAYLVDVARRSVGIVYARRLDTGVESEIFRDAVTDLALNAVADQARRAAAQSSMGTSMGMAFTVGGEGIPVRHAGTHCTPARPEGCPVGPLTMSADGRYLVYRGGIWPPSPEATALPHNGLMVFDAESNTNLPLPVAHPALAPEPWPVELGTRRISGDGQWIGTTAPLRDAGHPTAIVVHRATGRVSLVAPRLGATTLLDLSDDGHVALLAGPYSLTTSQSLWVVNRRRGIITRVVNPLDAPPGSRRLVGAALSGDGSTVVATFAASWIPMSFDRFTLSARLDADADGMSDAWETTFGLDPASAADAALDPDGDGRTSAQEYADGTHPRGVPVRYFAEGANGAFFSTSLALFNPTDADVTANVRFLGADGAAAAMPITVPAQSPAYIEADDANLPFTEFSIVVESPAPLVAERRMTWDRTSDYGSHSGTGVAAPATTWHFAEGATIAGMQTFFLLQNPGDVATTATLRYQLATGAVHERVHSVPAASRLTVWANQEGTPLDAAEFATTVLSDQPIVVERAMYRDAPGETFAAGSVASGVVSPATSWFFAEGATGAFFDTYLLLSNPGDAAATVDVEFTRAHDVTDISTALPIARQYVVPARSRQTIWVAQEDPDLRDTQVGARMTSSQPIVAERTMWWPGPTSATWRENHAETGSPASGRLWAMADVQADADDGGWDTFVLVATTEQFLSVIRVTVACDDGTTVTRDKRLSVNRTTLWMRYEFPEIVGRRCATMVESLPTRITLSPIVPLYRTPLVVEKAMYRGYFAAGGVTLATRLPDPPE